MAITQSRMIELIRIADNLKSDLLSFQTFIREIIAEVPPGQPESPALSALQAVQNYAHSLTIAPRDLETLANERAHFKQNATKNARQAAKIRAKRIGVDTLPAPTAPHAIGKRLPQQHAAAFMPSTQRAITQVQAQPQSTSFDFLATCKKQVNEMYEKTGQKIPYPDPFDEQPLLSDHAKHFGLDQQGDDDGLF